MNVDSQLLGCVRGLHFPSQELSTEMGKLVQQSNRVWELSMNGHAHMPSKSGLISTPRPVSPFDPTYDGHDPSSSRIIDVPADFTEPPLKKRLSSSSVSTAVSCTGMDQSSFDEDQHSQNVIDSQVDNTRLAELDVCVVPCDLAYSRLLHVVAFQAIVNTCAPLMRMRLDVTTSVWSNLLMLSLCIVMPTRTILACLHPHGLVTCGVDFKYPLSYYQDNYH